MKCPICSSENPENQSLCSLCGSSLNDPLKQMDAAIDEELRNEMSKALEHSSGMVSPVGAVSPAKNDQEATKPHPSIEWESFFSRFGRKLEQLKEFVFECSFIQSNQLYRERIDRTQFDQIFSTEELLGLEIFPDQINAFAVDFKNQNTPHIIMCRGIVVASRLIALGLAWHIHNLRHNPTTRHLKQLLFGIRNRLKNNDAVFSEEDAISLAEEHFYELQDKELSEIIALTNSISSAMLIYIIAHEAGHIALGHTLGQKENFDISRNQEREADSFAASCLSVSPFREYLFLGQVFVNILFSWQDDFASEDVPKTHPCSIERFHNAFENNSDAAKELEKEFGLTKEELSQFLPQAS